MISQKKMAADILKCGVSRIRITDMKQVEEALTRNDIKDLIQKGVIVKVQKRGNARIDARHRLVQKGKGRRRGRGSRKGSAGAMVNKKTLWMRKIRPIRKLIRELREDKRIGPSIYRELYSKSKGGFFRNKKHVLLYLKENNLLKGERSRKAKTAKKVKK